MKLPYLAFLLFPLFAFAKQDIDFNSQIKSLLSNRCIACHGPDEEHREAGLRLDTFDGATRDSMAIPLLFLAIQKTVKFCFV